MVLPFFLVENHFFSKLV